LPLSFGLNAPALIRSRRSSASTNIPVGRAGLSQSSAEFQCSLRSGDGLVFRGPPEYGGWFECHNDF
ncbi:hypothetical protein, partial [Limnobaculum xujianqingii]|uniref:hypothetical protein n=1 Tax=Limnobaculum xujianqingii TaxID=2738837 RepID=UPI001E55C0DC